MKRASLLILVGLIIACISVPVAAEPNKSRSGYGLKAGRAFRGPRKGPGYAVGMILKMKEELGLSDSQVEQLKALRGEVKEQMKAVKAKRAAMQEAVKAGAEESEIRAAAAELGKTLGDQAVLKVSTKAKIDGILTEDQQSKLKEQCAKGKPEAGRFAKDRKAPGMVAIGPEAVFAEIDTDGDGAISPEEFKAHMEQMRERFAGAGPRGPMGPGGPMGLMGHRRQRGHWGRGPGCPMRQSHNYPVNQPED
jgi:Spy/CpxP family protein refolding chaperone